ncbi:uncharacterized protein LOC111223737 isoform X1 [Seriola dumerili]|uniref:uncharacterized protein LOC111223737 isoform X1 n=1 Tax=Seriola dumerili TaxID=41447 RepID=UPI000BBED77B|nr:uncharacterized protein LOC111223737 isoform X1 [Seriola dumerili]
MDDSSPRPVRSMFAWLVGASQVLGLASVVLTGVWMGHYRGGFAWNGSAQEFNLHPLCMVLGLVFLHGDAILVYRVFRNEAKRNVKLLHGIIHLLALIISIIVGDGFAVLPVSGRIIRATGLVPPHPCVLWSGAAGYGHREQSARHHGETPLQHHADLLPVRPRGGAGQHFGDRAGVFWGAAWLLDHQGRLQTPAQPRGRVSVCPLQDPD